MIVKNSGESLSLALSHFGKTQRDLARACGYTHEHIHRLLQGKVKLSLSARERLTNGIQALITAENIL